MGRRVRYEVSIVLTQHHSFAVDANTDAEASMFALSQLGQRTPSHSELHVTVDLGVNTTPKGTP